MDRYGCVPLPFSAPTANFVAELCVVPLRIAPYGKPDFGSNVGNGTRAIASFLVATWVFAWAMWEFRSASDPVGPFTPMTNTMLPLRSPASWVTASMTESISPSWLCPTIMLITNDGGASCSTFCLSLSR